MGNVLLITNIPRRQGYLYYCATSKKGNIVVCEALMARGGRKKKLKGKVVRHAAE